MIEDPPLVTALRGQVARWKARKALHGAKPMPAYKMRRFLRESVARMESDWQELRHRIRHGEIVQVSPDWFIQDGALH